MVQAASHAENNTNINTVDDIKPSGQSVNAEVATRLIPASSDTVESEGQQMKQC